MKAPTLTCESLHIWHISLNPEDVGVATTQKTLSTVEQARAARFRSTEARDAYIAARCAVRHILSSYLKITSGQLQLAVNEYDKPMLAPGCYKDDIRFNISHCADNALLAVTLGKEVGIDLERLDIKRRIIPVARRYFTEQTVNALSNLTGPDQKYAFLHAWTRYEAYKKAQGTGLRGDDSKLDFDIAKPPVDAFFPLFAETTEPTWLASMLKLDAGWIGAVVLENTASMPKLNHYVYPGFYAAC